jgi:hypothetical protein
MRLHFTKTYTRNGKDYGVWKVHLPPEEIGALGWRNGEELEAKVIAGAIVLKRLPKAKVQT